MAGNGPLPGGRQTWARRASDPLEISAVAAPACSGAGAAKARARPKARAARGAVFVRTYTLRVRCTAIPKEKKAKLERAGWKVGSVAAFLGLSAAEEALVELRLTLSRGLRDRRTR